MNQIIQSKNTLKLLSFFGIILPIFDIMIFSILGAIRPGYNPLTQMISELGEVSAPNSTFASVYFIVGGILLILFAIGLYQGLKEIKGAWIGPFLLALDGVFDYIGSGVFPCDLGCTGQKFSGMMHLFVSLIGMVAMTLVPFFIWKSLKGEGKWQGYDKLSLIIGIIIVVMIGVFMISFATNILTGLTQRILYYIYLSWIFIMAVKLFRLVDSMQKK